MQHKESRTHHRLPGSRRNGHLYPWCASRGTLSSNGRIREDLGRLVDRRVPLRKLNATHLQARYRTVRGSKSKPSSLQPTQRLCSHWATSSRSSWRKLWHCHNRTPSMIVARREDLQPQQLLNSITSSSRTWSGYLWRRPAETSYPRRRRGHPSTRSASRTWPNSWVSRKKSWTKSMSIKKVRPILTRPLAFLALVRSRTRLLANRPVHRYWSVSHLSFPMGKK